MELSSLSLSQSSTQHKSILVDAQGIPLKINLQAVELEGRPKLVRTLKTSGALVVSNAKEAAVILVDSATESGKRLIRTWGHDSSKVVLEYTWVKGSIGVGRPLLAVDNWGGALTIDDGQPVTIDGVVVDEDELEEVEALVTKSPLPTPRVTPVDAMSQRPENTVAERSDIRSEANKSHFTEPPPQTPAAVQPTVLGTTPAKESTRVEVSPVESPQLPPITQPLPYFQPNLFVQPSQSQTYAYPPFPTQQPYTSLQPQSMPTQSFSHMGLPSPQPQITNAPSLPHASLPPVQPPMMQTTSTAANATPMNMQTPNFATIMTIMEVVRHMDQSSWLGQNQSSISQPSVHSSTPFSEKSTTPKPASSILGFQTTEKSESPEADASLTSSQDGYMRNTPPEKRKQGSRSDFPEDRPVKRKYHIGPLHRPSDELLSPMKSRKRLPAIRSTNPPLKRLRKGKEREVYSDSKHFEVDEITEVSDDSCSASSSASTPARLRNIIVHKKRGEIFLSESGQPLRFFVQVDLHGRHTVVTNIKKNKGKIVNSIADADYSIMFPRSDTFQGLLDEAIALGKTPILTAFVADCLEEGALLDETDYIVESVAKVKALKRGRQSALSIKVETAESIAHQVRTVKPKSSSATGGGQTPLSVNKSKKAAESVPSRPTVEEQRNSTGSRSPTPPIAATRQLMKSGKYLFTGVEDDYVLRLARHCLIGDPTISNSALVSKIHKKMPHHSTASWMAHVDKKLRGELEDIRKRANIAKRKRSNGTANHTFPQVSINEGTPYKGHMPDTAEMNENIPPNPRQPSQEELERQDFGVITRFFASGGGGDDDDDERVWQSLEDYQRCRSASSWPDYYAAHQEQVYARIEELTKERARN